jgi:hypothetical protein
MLVAFTRQEGEAHLRHSKELAALHKATVRRDGQGEVERQKLPALDQGLTQGEGHSPTDIRKQYLVQPY